VRYENGRRGVLCPGETECNTTFAFVAHHTSLLDPIASGVEAAAARFDREDYMNPGDERRESQAGEAVDAVLRSAGIDDLAEAVSELVDAGGQGDRDAANLVAAFGQLHPPRGPGEPGATETDHRAVSGVQRRRSLGCEG
jgi:hypothetical protein